MAKVVYMAYQPVFAGHRTQHALRGHRRLAFGHGRLAVVVLFVVVLCLQICAMLATRQFLGRNATMPCVSCSRKQQLSTGIPGIDPTL